METTKKPPAVCEGCIYLQKVCCHGASQYHGTLPGADIKHCPLKKTKIENPNFKASHNGE
jgi:hypothetical protein